METKKGFDEKNRKEDYSIFDIKDSLWGCFSVSIWVAYLTDKAVTFWSALQFAALLTFPTLFAWIVGAAINKESRKKTRKLEEVVCKVIWFAVYVFIVSVIVDYVR